MRGRPNQMGETLPPHDADAEAAALGCVLLDNGCLDRMRERFEGRGNVFYVEAHRVIVSAMGRLRAAGKAIDVITLKDELGTDGTIQAGGLGYLAGLPDRPASAANLEHYLEILWEKYLCRLQLAYAWDISQRIRLNGHLTEADVVRIDEHHAEFKRLSQAGTVTPQLLAEPKEFLEEYYAKWFGLKGEEAGWKLAVPLADLRIREHELTIFTAENGAGKSTYLGHLAVAIAAQGAKVVVASLEEHVADTLHMLSRQLLGSNTDRMEQTEANRRLLAQGLAWLQRRFRFYNFLGIGNWRDILDCFKYARTRLGYEVFVLDSMMKIGIPDDDYAGQSVAVNAFADFCLSTGAHVILVVHQNKAEGGVSQLKRKVRGAGTVTDVANVIMSIRRNEKKEEESTDLWQRREVEERILNNPNATADEKARARMEMQQIHSELGQLRAQWDSEVRLLKQRKKGTRQNGSRKLWFDRMSLQFRGSPEDPVVNYLAHSVPVATKTNTENTKGTENTEAPGGAATATTEIEQTTNTNNNEEKENEE